MNTHYSTAKSSNSTDALDAAQEQRPNLFFLHGLDSSIKGYKACWFAQHYPAMRMHNYSGDLPERLTQLEAHLSGLDHLILVGSSFGGLMATCWAAQQQERLARIDRLILLAPALNFADYLPPPEKLPVEARLFIGTQDTVCPPALVLPLARQSFSKLSITLLDDDHMLHDSFPRMDWPNLLSRHNSTHWTDRWHMHWPDFF